MDISVGMAGAAGAAAAPLIDNGLWIPLVFQSLKNPHRNSIWESYGSHSIWNTISESTRSICWFCTHLQEISDKIGVQPDH